MTKGTFGDNLKREREMRGVSLDEITAATRIATRFLRAIENEEWDQLPGGVFNRGFVRAVAHYLGLDEESIVAEYALTVNDRPGVPVWTGRPPAVVPDRPWLAWIFVAIAAVAILGGGWFATRRIVAWRAARRSAPGAFLDASPSAASSPEAPPKLPPSSTPAVAATGSATNSSPASAGPPAPADSVPATTATTADSAPMELKIESVKRTKLTVEADAARVFNGTVKAGENHTFSAKDRFQISSRDAGALVLQLNGKTLAPMGPLGHAGKVTLTREVLKGDAGGEN